MKNSHFKKLEKIYLNAKVNKEIYSNTEIIISKNYSEIKDSLEILALTPTTYPIYQSSIFAPNL